MSDSESEGNISDLEAQQEENGSDSDGEETEKPELKGILDDVEETEVSWKDLVSFAKTRVKTKILFLNCSKGLN
jgi:hypothetical protein